jgi:alanyl-tRNA synthetase
MMGEHYTALKEQKEYIKEQLSLEEQRFLKTIDIGMDIFDKELQQTKDIFSGDVAFKLYDTYGFPLDLTQDMLRDKGLQVDQKRFDELMQQQRTKAKSAFDLGANTPAGANLSSFIKVGSVLPIHFTE